jgi:hypothetical protein
MQQMGRVGVVWALAMVGLAGGIAEAQEHEVRAYIVPKLGNGSFLNPYRAKYITKAPSDLASSILIASPLKEVYEYMNEPAFFVVADATVEEHTALSAQPDVVALPANLDAPISAAALPTVQAKLEALKFPSTWVTTDHTYRQVLQVVARLCTLSQWWSDLFPGQRMFPVGTTLDTRINQMPASWRQQWQALAAQRGLDISTVSGTTLLRNALRIVVPQIPLVRLQGEDF